MCSAQDVDKQQAKKQRAQQTLTAKFQIDPGSFPKGYSFKVAMKATMTAADHSGALDSQMGAIESKIKSDLAQGKTIGSQTIKIDLSDQKGNNLYTLASKEPHNWQISYDGDKPGFKGAPQKVEFIFPAEPPNKNESSHIIKEILFEGELTILIDGQAGPTLPLEFSKPYSPDTDYILQIANNVAEDGKSSIVINLLLEIVQEIVQSPRPLGKIVIDK
jgi:hypothetical protein